MLEPLYSAKCVLACDHINTLDKMAQNVSSADALILESDFPEAGIQALLKQSQCPILFINDNGRNCTQYAAAVIR